MEFNSENQIRVEGGKVYHKSAGGFVFYEDSENHKLFVALIKPKGEDGLFIPKGHLKKGEEPLEAAKREIMEELSLSVTPDHVAYIGKDEYSFTLADSDKTHYKSVDLFLFSLDSKEKINPPTDEDIDKVVWIELNEALEKLAYDRENLLKAKEIFGI